MKKQIDKLLPLLAALLLLNASCAKELNVPGTEATSSKEITISVAMPGEADTRVAYDDSQVGASSNKALTWQEGDTIAVVGMDGNRVKGIERFHLTAGTGTASAQFNGKPIPGASSYRIYYPGNSVQIANDGTVALDMNGQTQTADNSAGHLGRYILLQKKEVTDLTAPLTLEMASAVMKFELKDIPAETGALKKLVMSVPSSSGLYYGSMKNMATQAMSFVPGAVTFSESKRTLTAYLSFLPEQIPDLNALYEFQVWLVGDRIYKADAPSKSAKIYQPGKRYTAALSQWKPTVEMRFSLKTQSPGENYTFGFTGAFHPANLLVDWNDGLFSSHPKGALSYSNEHSYAKAGTYTVTLFSDQTDFSKPQIAALKFDSQLTALHTPLLNMNSSYIDCFSECNNLTSIREDVFIHNTHVENFESCFIGCTGLTSLPEGLFAFNKQAKKFSGCFVGCTRLASLPEGLFAHNTKARTFDRCFIGCTGLTSLPEGLFAFNKQAEIFNSCFRKCSGLTGLPERLFAQNTKASDFGQCFRFCTSLTSLPAGLFAGNTQAKIFSECFTDCSALTALPAGLFDQNTQATNFYFCFARCSNLASIPARLFARCAQAEIFSDCFRQCFHLTSLPEEMFGPKAVIFKYCFVDCTGLKNISEGVFKNCTEAVNFENCFQGCSNLASLPAGLFAHCAQAESFSDCFQGCSNLTGLPAELFAHNPKAKYFTSCFSDCARLTDLPALLFAHNPEIDSFYECFHKCLSLTSLPAELFAHNPKAWTFDRCFTDCSRLTAIPAELFTHNPEISGFAECFLRCTSLTAIPAGLFDHNPKANSFMSCFQGCTKLATIPEGLFARNTEATSFNFSFCFQGCVLASMNPKIFSTAADPTDCFKDKRVNFEHCFDAVGQKTAASNPPALWKYNPGTGNWQIYRCFFAANFTPPADYNFAWGQPL